MTEPDATGRFVVPVLVTAQREAREEMRQWLIQALPNRHRIANKVVPKGKDTSIVLVRFLTEEDAALFKLFWSD